MILILVAIAFGAIGAAIYSGGGWTALGLYVIGSVAALVVSWAMQVVAYGVFDGKDQRELDSAFNLGYTAGSRDSTNPDGPSEGQGGGAVPPVPVETVGELTDKTGQFVFEKNIMVSDGRRVLVKQMAMYTLHDTDVEGVYDKQLVLVQNLGIGVMMMAGQVWGMEATCQVVDE